MSDCRHLRQTDEPNGWTICVDCEANISRWASTSDTKLAAIADVSAPKRKEDADSLREFADMVEAGAITEYVIVANCVRDHEFLALATFDDRWRILGALEYAKYNFSKEPSK